MNRTGVVGVMLLIALVGLSAATIGVEPASFDETLFNGTSAQLNLTFTNPDENASATVDIGLSGDGAELLSLPTHPFTVFQNSTKTVVISVSVPKKYFTDVIDEPDLSEIVYHPLISIDSATPLSRHNIPITLTVKNSAVVTPTFSNTTLVVSLVNPPISPSKRMLLTVRTQDGQPASGNLTIVSGAFSIVPVYNGLAIYTAPSEVTCPVYGFPQVAGYMPSYFFFTEESSQCVPTGGAGGGTSGGKDMEFKPSGVTMTVEQNINREEGFWLKNNLAETVTIIGGEFTSGTTLTSDGIKPVRVRNLPHDDIASGGKIFVTFTVDTSNVLIGSFLPVFTVYGETATGKDVSAVFRFSIDVIRSMSAANQTVDALRILVDDAFEVGDTATVSVRSGGDAIAGADLRITLPDGTQYDYVTPSGGTITMAIPQEGDYRFRAEKSGYTTASYNMTIGQRDIQISTNDPLVGDVLKVKVYVGENVSVKTAKVKITRPNSESVSMYTSSTGEVTLLTNETGTYSIDASKAGYTSGWKQIAVNRKALKIIASTIELGKPSILTAKTDDEARIIQGVRISMTSPTAKQVNLSLTSSNGEATFTPTESGDYAVVADKEGYSTATQTINVPAKNLEVTTEGEVGVGKTVSVLVKYNGAPQAGVTLEITKPDNSKASFITASDGKAAISLDKVGTYSVAATSPAFSQSTTTIAVTKKTMTITPTFYDRTSAISNSPVCEGTVSASPPVTGAVVTLLQPNGVTVALTTRATTSRGTYSVKATATDYDDASTDFTVTCPVVFLIAPLDIQKDSSIYAKFDASPQAVTLNCEGQIPVSLSTVSETFPPGASSVNWTVSQAGSCSLCADESIGGQCKTFKVTEGLLTQEQMMYVGGAVLVVVVFLFLRSKGFTLPSGRKKSGAGEFNAAFEENIGTA